MYTCSYNHELKTAQAEIIRLFSNITIVTKEKGQLMIPCLFGQTSRILKSIMNPQAAAQVYPLITIERGNIQIDMQRNSELQHDISIMTSSHSYNPNTKPPTPIIMDFTISCFSKYPEELDMIVTNFIPFFNKDVFVVTPHPKLENRVLKHQIIWTGDVTFDWKTVLQNTEQDIQIATFKLQYKTEIFGGLDKITDLNGGDIYTINLGLNPSNGEIYTDFDPEHPDGNLLGGFQAVPYAESFASYSKSIITKYLAGDCDADFIITNAFNAQFNSAILNHDINAIEAAVSKGANIYKKSYWPYKYAENQDYEDIMTWLREHYALIPNEEHYVDAIGDRAKVEINRDRWIASEFGERAGKYQFRYLTDGWHYINTEILPNVDKIVDLAVYGITFSGKAVLDDTVDVDYKIVENGDITVRTVDVFINSADIRIADLYIK